ncbi:metallophosphoesterase [Paenibacillus sp. NEAU-GSW1]|uniref:metallophosphoesterase n=1 Tax=Paenibacillus sp. NEAU-GSW1 TaxID=2682486 RepID=UPI0012E112CC|nr:metallophosphoesterase [Paenibacillus sp. NEAU-GSW1]MUT67077.1 metallophosphoesterase [Paenibacillus sp. NEAU-GSW1]
MEYAIAAIIVLIVIYALFIFPTQWLKVERIRHDAGLGIKMLQISDLHVEKIRISAALIKRLIETESPSYIFITGDITQNGSALPKARRYLEAVASCGIPVYAVLGNHDHRLKPHHKAELEQMLLDTGIRLLNNECFDAGPFQLVGIDDYGSKKSRPEQAFQHVDPAKPVIVLTHDPNLVLHLNYRYAYLMAGHFHGMQFHVPFLFRYIRKGKLAADGIIKGLHENRYGVFYISKGISQAGPNARFLIRSEVTVHQL